MGDDQYGEPQHQPVVYQTSNGGATWQEQYSPAINMTFTGVDFVDANHGWVVGLRTLSTETDGKIFHTTDGGATWERQDNKSSGPLWDVHFVDANRGYVVGSLYGAAWGPILHNTLDGGATWNKLHLNKWDEPAFYGVWVASGNHLVAVGDHDFICYSTAPWQTPDVYGQNPFIEEKVINIHYNFTSVCFADADRGWAVGQRQFDSGAFGSFIFGTKDGGGHLADPIRRAG